MKEPRARESSEMIFDAVKQTATCIRCGRVLRNPAHIAAGYGPVCLRKLGLVTTRQVRPKDTLVIAFNLADYASFCRAAFAKEIVTYDDQIFTLRDNSKVRYAAKPGQVEKFFGMQSVRIRGKVIITASAPLRNDYFSFINFVPDELRDEAMTGAFAIED